MKKVLLLLVFVFAVLPVMADGIHLGYCDGALANKSNGLITGQTGTNATIEGAIFIQPVQLGAYKACQITSLYVGLAEDAAEYPAELTAWVRADNSSENLASGKITRVKGGWSTIKLDNPLTIGDFAGKGLWVGFGYVQSKKLNVLAFLSATPAVENSGWMAKNGKWTDYSSKGILPIEAIVEGDALPQCDLTLRSAVASPDIVQIGGVISVKATVRNNALTKAVKPVLKYSVAEGKIKGTYTINKTLNYRDAETVHFDIPAEVISDEGEQQVTVTLAWADGKGDDYEDDNTVTFPVQFSKDVYLRKLLVEEGTGAWCGWCVRGLVGLKEMREQYPNQFIGIGVHNNDDYVVADYDNWMSKMISGYPSCIINRSGSAVDPEFSILKSNLLNMEVVAEAGIQTVATLENGKLQLQSEVRFGKNVAGGSYNLTYVVVEDQLPINQKNYYAGGGYGEMGGFESLGSSVQMNIDDVARAIFPSASGSALEGSNFTKNSPYTHTLTADMPQITDLKNTSVVTILTNNANGAVVNAERSAIVDPTGIEHVAAPSIAGNTCIYNLSGQRLNHLQRGINIVGGKKIVK